MKRVGSFYKNKTEYLLREIKKDGGFHKNKTIYLLKERERKQFDNFYKQNIFLEIIGGFY